MVDHNLEVFLLPQIDQFLCLHGIACKRLLNEYVFTVFECRLGQVVVRPNRRDHGDGIDVRRLDQFVRIAIDGNSGIRCLYPFAGCWSLIADADNLTTVYRAQIAHDIRAPITVADDAKSKHRSSPYKADVLAQTFTGNLQEIIKRGSKPGSNRVTNRRRRRSSLLLESAARFSGRAGENNYGHTANRGAPCRQFPHGWRRGPAT